MHHDHKMIWTRPDNVPSLVPDFASAREYGERVMREARAERPSFLAKIWRAA